MLLPPKAGWHLVLRPVPARIECSAAVLDLMCPFATMDAMTEATMQRRINSLEAEIKMLKTAVARKPDLSVDEKNWRKIQTTAKKVRAKLYRARYA